MIHPDFAEYRAVDLRRDAAARRLLNAARPRRRFRRGLRPPGESVSRT